MNEELAERSKVSVTFTRSSTKDGGQGYTIHVEEGASEDEAARVFGIANSLRDNALAVLSGKSTAELLAESIAESIAAMENKS